MRNFAWDSEERGPERQAEKQNGVKVDLLPGYISEETIRPPFSAKVGTEFIIL